VPRPALHDTEAVLDATRELILDVGPRGTGIREISRRSGAPSGSLYHRFSSRDNLVALAWLRAVRRFQAGYLQALECHDPAEAIRHAIAWAVEYALREPRDTRLLLSHSQADLLDRAPAAETIAQLAAVNQRLEVALRDLSRRLFKSSSRASLERVSNAVIDLPYAALRRHVLARTLSPRTIAPLQAAALAIVADRGEAQGR
jgi:AcrR family transcriptional regulator